MHINDRISSRVADTHPKGCRRPVCGVSWSLLFGSGFVCGALFCAVLISCACSSVKLSRLRSVFLGIAAIYVSPFCGVGVL